MIEFAPQTFLFVLKRRDSIDTRRGGNVRVRTNQSSQRQRTDTPPIARHNPHRRCLSKRLGAKKAVPMGRLILEFEGMFRTSRLDDELGSQEAEKTARCFGCGRPRIPYS